MKLRRHSHLIKGRRYTVYHDPLTRQEPEGPAVVQTVLGSCDRETGLAYAQVLFEDGDVAHRWVHPEDLDSQVG